MENYNNTAYRTIKARPVDIFNEADTSHQEQILATIIQIADRVTLMTQKKVFDKGNRYLLQKLMTLLHSLTLFF